MVNKKKRPKKIPVIGDHGTDVPSDLNGQMTFSMQSNQSCGSFEVKQEADIKQEPVSVGELVDVPISTYENATHRHDSNESDAENDFDFQSLDEVKENVKKECDDKKKEEEEPKMSADFRSGDGAMSSQPNQPMHDESDFELPQRNDKNNNEQKRGGDAHGNPSKRYKCDFCEYSTDFKGHLNQHLLKHTGEKPHGCKFCPKRFTEKRYLLAHMKAHVGEFLIHCPSCLDGFSDKDEKKAHETSCKAHRYECHLCKESFGSHKINMMNHMRVHSGDKPFECKECFKKFKLKANLSRHMKLHAGLCSFRCSKCNTRFTQKDEKNTHEEMCNRTVFECDVCHKSFVCNSHLILHMRTHTGQKPFECKKCPRKFTQKVNLKVHMKLHTVELSSKCLICRKGFLKDDKRKAHQRNCNGRYYECYLCKKFFDKNIALLKGHMHTHSGEKQFQCQLCRNTFTLKVNLNRHMKNIHHKKF